MVLLVVQSESVLLCFQTTGNLWGGIASCDPKITRTTKERPSYHLVGSVILRSFLVWENETCGPYLYRLGDTLENNRPKEYGSLSMPKKIRRLEGMSSIIVDDETVRVFLVAPSIAVADKIVELWNNNGGKE